MKTILLTAFAALALLTQPAPAGIFSKAAKKDSKEKNEGLPPDQRMPKADARLAKMRELITRGTTSGTLTKAESGSLTRELEAVERREEQYRRSMDKVTGGERRKLNSDITDLHARI